MEQFRLNWRQILILAGGYFFLARVGMLFRVQPDLIALFWPAAGLGLAALVLTTVHLWPGIALGVLVSTLASGGSLATSVLWAAGSTLSAVFGWWLLRRFEFEPRMDRTLDVTFFGVFAFVLSPLPAAIFGVSGVMAGGAAGLNLPGFFSNLWNWWAGDALGLLIEGPLLLSWGSQPMPRLKRHQQIEIALLLALLAVSTHLVYGEAAGFQPQRYLMFYLALTIHIWTAMRFGARGASLALLIAGTIAAIHTTQDRGPFASGGGASSVLLFQVQTMLISFTALAAAAGMSERSRAREALERAYTSLEIQVRQRTRELVRSNSNLQAEIAEHIQTAETLKQSRARYRAIVEDQIEPVCRWLPDMTLTYVNQAFCSHYNRSREALIGMSFLGLLPEEVCDPLLKLAQSLTPENPTASSEAWIWLPGGEERWFQWTHRALFDQNQQLVEFQTVGVDITERKQRERELEIEAGLSASLRAANSRLGVFSTASAQLETLLPADGVILAHFDAHQERFIFGQGAGIWQELDGRASTAVEVATKSVVETRQAVVFEPPFDSIPDLGIFNGTQLAVVIGMPLVAQDQLVGVLWVGRFRRLSRHEKDLLALMAEIIANAADRMALIEFTQTNLKRLTVLRAIDVTINASLDLRLTLGVVLDQITNHLGVDAAGVLVLDPHRQLLEYAQVRGMRTLAYQSLQVGLVDTLAGQAAVERRTIIINNYADQHEPVSLALRLSGESFTAYVGVPLMAKGQVKGVLELFSRKRLDPDTEWLDFLSSVAAQSAMAIDNAQMFDQLQRANLDMTVAYDATIDGWARAFEMRNNEREGHSHRVANDAVQIARLMSVPETDLLDLRRGALLHDIGNLVVPDRILFKPGPLNEGEWEVIKQHPAHAYELLVSIPYLHSAVDIPYCHHERWDGSGYPRGLRGEQIPLAARIFAVVDVWDAMRSPRPWRDRCPDFDVMNYMTSQAGKAFDPAVIEAFMALAPSLEGAD